MNPGDKFNRLTVVSFHHKDERHRKYYLFRCDCGKEKVILSYGVKDGNTKSCGCLLREVQKNKRISKNHSEVTAILLGYKRHAKDRGFEWALSRKEVEEFIKQNCHYCGQPPSNTKKTKNSIGNGLKYSGIDRIDNSKGYFSDNCVPCCQTCNVAKRDLTIEEFKSWIKKISKKMAQWG